MKSSKRAAKDGCCILPGIQGLRTKVLYLQRRLPRADRVPAQVPVRLYQCIDRMSDRYWRVTHGARPALSDTRRQWHRSHRGLYVHRNGGWARVRMQVPLPAAQARQTCNEPKKITSTVRRGCQRLTVRANGRSQETLAEELGLQGSFYFSRFEATVCSGVFCWEYQLVVERYDDELGIKGNASTICFMRHLSGNMNLPIQKRKSLLRSNPAHKCDRMKEIEAGPKSHGISAVSFVQIELHGPCSVLAPWIRICDILR